MEDSDYKILIVDDLPKNLMVLGNILTKKNYQIAYANKALIRLLPKGEWPAIKHVANTPFADLNFSIYQKIRQISIFCAIDNLLKGAASQAIQLFNLQQGLTDSTSLLAEYSK